MFLLAYVFDRFVIFVSFSLRYQHITLTVYATPLPTYQCVFTKFNFKYILQQCVFDQSDGYNSDREREERHNIYCITDSGHLI